MEKHINKRLDDLKTKIDKADHDGWFKRKYPTKKKRLMAAVAIAFAVVVVLGAFNSIVLGQ